jgi:hypothetical protein
LFECAALVEVGLERFAERRLFSLAFVDKFFAADFGEDVIVIAGRVVFIFFDRRDGKLHAVGIEVI